MVKIEKCPVCGKRGSLQKRYVLNSQGKRFEPYTYVAHYHSKRERNEALMQGENLPKITFGVTSRKIARTLYLT